MKLRPLSALSALVTAAAVAALAPPSAGAQQLTHVEGLGSLAFPNSGAAEAQSDFLRGVLLLHSFEYDYAAQAFRRAQDIDPDFALAYWGEAMTYTHPVWNQKDLDAAREALARYAPTPEARAAKAPTERERGYLTAVDVLYGEGNKATLDTLYSTEMAKLAEAYPDDMEARTFFALSLLGLSQGDRDVPTYMEAGAIALDAFYENPDHPGAAHYTIHSFDDPTHAILAMGAAQAYGPMAPDAGHAQHMTTHIFLARGMWGDVVEANIRADAVTDRNLAARDLPPTSCGHYNEWLMYGYQQQGRYDDAEALLLECYQLAHDERLPEAMRARAGASFVHMRNLHLADARDWDGPAVTSLIEVDGDATRQRVLQSWGSGVAAIHRGDREEAEAHYAVVAERVEEIAGGFQGPYGPVWKGTLEALLLADAGEGERALDAAARAADYEASLPVDFGPPVAFKPARELHGEILLSQGRPEDAMAAFEMALARTPNRIHSVAGYARAAAAAERVQRAVDAYGLLADLLQHADGDVAELREAQAFLSSRAEQPDR